LLKAYENVGRKIRLWSVIFQQFDVFCDQFHRFGRRITHNRKFKIADRTAIKVYGSDCRHGFGSFCVLDMAAPFCSMYTEIQDKPSLINKWSTGWVVLCIGLRVKNNSR